MFIFLGFMFVVAILGDGLLDLELLEDPLDDGSLRNKLHKQKQLKQTKQLVFVFGVVQTLLHLKHMSFSSAPSG